MKQTLLQVSIISSTNDATTDKIFNIYITLLSSLFLIDSLSQFFMHRVVSTVEHRLSKQPLFELSAIQMFIGLFYYPNAYTYLHTAFPSKQKLFATHARLTISSVKAVVPLSESGNSILRILPRQFFNQFPSAKLPNDETCERVWSPISI